MHRNAEAGGDRGRPSQSGNKGKPELKSPVLAPLGMKSLKRSVVGVPRATYDLNGKLSSVRSLRKARSRSPHSFAPICPKRISGEPEPHLRQREHLLFYSSSALSCVGFGETEET